MAPQGRLEQGARSQSKRDPAFWILSCCHLTTLLMPRASRRQQQQQQGHRSSNEQIGGSVRPPKPAASPLKHAGGATETSREAAGSGPQEAEEALDLVRAMLEQRNPALLQRMQDAMAEDAADAAAAEEEVH